MLAVIDARRGEVFAAWPSPAAGTDGARSSSTPEALAERFGKRDATGPTAGEGRDDSVARGGGCRGASPRRPTERAHVGLRAEPAASAAEVAAYRAPAADGPALTSSQPTPSAGSSALPERRWKPASTEVQLGRLPISDLPPCWRSSAGLSGRRGRLAVRARACRSRPVSAWRLEAEGIAGLPDLLPLRRHLASDERRGRPRLGVAGVAGDTRRATARQAGDGARSRSRSGSRTARRSRCTSSSVPPRRNAARATTTTTARTP